MNPIIPIYQVDAFADGPFTGNPAAVCYLMKAKPSSWMQQVAAEMNLSETAFFRLRDDLVELRWFTPATEVDLCGHATLAAAHIIWETELVKPDAPIHFDTRSGVLTAKKAGKFIELDFPEDGAKPEPLSQEWLDRAKLNPLFTGRNSADILIEVGSEAEVRNFQADWETLNQLDCRGIILTAQSDNEDYDFISRFFAPRCGILEDPVTGSAHCALGPYWGAKWDTTFMTGYQASSRGGTIGIELKGDRVLLTGKAVTMLQGVLTSHPTEIAEVS